MEVFFIGNLLLTKYLSKVSGLNPWRFDDLIIGNLVPEENRTGRGRYLRIVVIILINIKNQVEFLSWIFWFWPPQFYILLVNIKAFMPPRTFYKLT